MDIFAFEPASFLSFLLTLMRVSILLFLLPFFGGETIPAQVKAFLCLVFTVAIWPAVALQGAVFPAHPGNIVLMLLGELVLGLGMGLMVHFIFAGIQLGGQIIGFQMGFSMLSMADPTTNQQLIVTSFILNLVAMAIFLALDGHLYLLSALMNSFKMIGPGDLLVTPRGLQDMISLSAGMFVLALKIAGPVIACLFMVELTLALMARTAPQMNLLVLGFPIKIAVGFLFFSIMFGLISLYIDEFVSRMGPMFTNYLRSVSP